MIGRIQLSGQPQLSSFIITQLHSNATNVIDHPSTPASIYSGVGVLGVAATNSSFPNYTALTDLFHLSLFLNATQSDAIQTNATTGNQDAFDDELPQIPAYIRLTSMVFCIAIMALGVIGNIMVPIVIIKTKDMRNSTNIFLTNLSIADLLVLLVCTPTVLVEVNSKPETWVLGREMCKAVPFVELTVAHASVLIILAISFERYYAICEPLKAGYVCTKARALLICFMSWIVAAVFTSPILFFAEYKIEEYIDGTLVAVCLTQASNAWTAGFFLMTISIFFILPLAILIVLYAIIARNLILRHDGIVKIRPNKPEFSYKARKQVVLMLGAVVLSFFFCLLPFRVLTLWIIIGSQETFMNIGIEAYYNILYFCRIMLYINSAINPILYNIMSSKFRKGFLRLCCWWQPFNSNLRVRPRTATFNTTTTSSSVLSRSFTRNTDGKSVCPSLEDTKRKKDINLVTHEMQDQECELQLLSHLAHNTMHTSSNGDSFRRLAISNLSNAHYVHSTSGNNSPELPSSIETINIA